MYDCCMTITVQPVHILYNMNGYCTSCHTPRNIQNTPPMAKEDGLVTVTGAGCRQLRSRSALVVFAGLGLIALTSMVARVLADSLELCIAQTAPEHLCMTLCGMVHGRLDSACTARAEVRVRT